MLIKLQSDNTFNETFETFQAYNIGRNLSKGTISYYETGRKSLISFMGGDFKLSLFDEDMLMRYISFLRNNGNSDITINTRLRGVRAMFAFFHARGYMRKIDIKMIKVDTQIKETYTDAELFVLLKRPDLKTCCFDDYRNWVVINYLLATGNRLSTIINIQIRDVSMSENEIALRHTKNRVQQIIPIASGLKSILSEYLRYRKPNHDTDYLFCTRHGDKLTTSGLINAIRRYNRHRGINKTSIHLFRHTFAKKWILNGGDILRLQKLLGHKSLDMVKEYVNMYGADLHKDYDKFNPLSNIQSKQPLKL